MVTITINGAQSDFKNGKLELQYFTTFFQFGDYPQQFSGSLQITPDDGVTVSSTEDEVKDAALLKIQALVKERVGGTIGSSTTAPVTTPTTTA